jgi:hypothetical protein
MSDLPVSPVLSEGDAATAEGRRPALALDAARLPGAVVALGVALVSAAIVLASAHARDRGELDGSNFTMGVLATLGLLGVAIGGRLLAASAERRAQLVSWPGAAGAVGLGVMLTVLIDDGSWSPYVVAPVVIALSVAGYLLTRAAPFVLTTIAAAALLYGRAFADVFDVEGDTGDNTFMAVGAGILVFVVAVTAAGWRLPATRVLSSVVVGLAGLAAMVGVLATVTTFRTFTAAFSTVTPSDDDPSGTFRDGTVVRAAPSDPLANDVWMILLYCALLAVLWTGCALATGHVGFRLLLVADGVVVVPLATYALLVSHPTWWEVGLTAVGGLALVGIGWRSADHRAPSTAQDDPRYGDRAETAGPLDGG